MLQIVKGVNFFDKYVEIKACIENMSLIVWNKSNKNIKFWQKSWHSALKLSKKN